MYKYKNKFILNKIDITKKDIFMVYFLIMLSGNPVLNNELVIKYTLPVMFVLTLALYGEKISRYWAGMVILGGVFIAAGLFQYINFSVFSLSMISILLKLIVGGGIIASLGSNFSEAYGRVMYFICSGSLFFYALQLWIGPESMPSLFETNFDSDVQRTFFFHLVNVYDGERNCGPFWEPGAFQGFINLTFLMSPATHFYNTVSGRRKGVMLFFALLTTFSTTGYLVFFAIVIFKIFINFKIKINSLLLIIVTPIIILFAYQKLEFLGGKVDQQIELFTISDEFNPGRFTVVVFDWHYITKNPVWGNGYVDVTRWADHPELQGRNLGHGNGFTGFIAAMGIASMLAYLVMLYRSSFFVNRIEALCFVIAIVLLLQGEHFLSLPLFMGLPFLQRGNNKSA
jgi:hypothetical protein